MGDENWEEETGVSAAPQSFFPMGRGFRPNFHNKESQSNSSQLSNSSGVGSLNDSSNSDHRRPGDWDKGRSRGFNDDNSGHNKLGSGGTNQTSGWAPIRSGSSDQYGKSSRDFSSSQSGGYNKGGGGWQPIGGGSRGFENDDNGWSSSGGGGGGSKGFDNNDDGWNPSGGGGSRSSDNNDSGNWKPSGGGGSRGFENGGGGRGRGGRGRGGGCGGFNRNDDDGGDGGNQGFGNDDDGRRGGGRGRGRGRGGGRGGFNRNDDDGGDGGNQRFGGGGRGCRNDDEDGGGGFGDDGGRRGRGGGRGRGGRGGGRGFDDDGSGFGRDGDKNNGDSEKPRENYVPPERPDDDETLFGGGVQVGVNFDKYNSAEVKATGENVPKPIESFDEAGLRPILNENVKKSGYKVPTPIQKYGIPILMSGRDLMACAQTGSGKTAAFLLPIAHKLLEVSRDYSDMGSANNVDPRALIITPTRELAIQIYDEARKFTKSSILKCHVVYGGTSSGHQTRQIFSGCDILVATPGRLLDLVGKGKIVFSSIQFMVLDEADRMLDMGFQGDVDKIIRHETMPETGNRQTLMFSATFPDAVQSLATKYLSDYIFVTVGIIGSACENITQTFIQVPKKEKRSKLKEILSEEQRNNLLHGILVFVEEKRTADFIAALLSESNFPTTSIHGDRLQRERETALDDFTKGRMAILVATSVAARGLDIKCVRHVINFDLPKDIDEYIHRIGRTGRVGNEGKATSFYDDQIDGRIQKELINSLGQANQTIPDWLQDGGSGDYGERSTFGGRDVRGDFSDAISSNQGSGAVETEESW